MNLIAFPGGGPRTLVQWAADFVSDIMDLTSWEHGKSSTLMGRAYQLCAKGKEESPRPCKIRC